MNCPDDACVLTGHGDECLTCPRCSGELWSSDQLAARAASLPGQLTPETRRDSGAFARIRACPSCSAPMAPLQIASMEAWVERCPTCGWVWLEKQDLRTMAMLARRQSRVAAFQSFRPEERQEMAQGLAAGSAGEGYPISGTHAALALLGIPVVRRTQGNVTPWATWLLGLLLVGVFLVGSLTVGTATLVERLGYHADGSLLALFTANLGHFDLMHLVGNLFFLLAFGDGVEQRVPRPLLWAAFFCLGALATAFQGLMADGPALIAGASAGVSALMGACVLLQPRARVVTGIGRAVVEVPIAAYGVFELGYQGLMALLERPGVAWYAHLAGLALGFAAATIWRSLHAEARPAQGAAS
ncbi:MAG: rhomboid family intramembrane serine protease [Deltaproteobacteria bacterium]|nr:rhomboid family intramembrane serine protease [Deltaproteobacteria bacterium]